MMNPYNEKRLRDEVIFLHALWHQGPPLPPPSQNPNVSPFPSPSQPYIPQHAWHLRPHQQHPVPTHTRSLPPLPSASFKKKQRQKRKKHNADPVRLGPTPIPPPEGSQQEKEGLLARNSQNKVAEWPCPVRSNSNSNWAGPKPDVGFEPKSDTNMSWGWTELKLGPTPPPEVSPEEKKKLLAMNLQNKACKALKQFLCSHDDDSDETDDDDDDGEYDEFENFFVGVFMEDHELRSYYQKCYESGEFCCLVCSAIGKKNSGKRFKDCAALLQHSMSILRTLKKRAHRGFGIALCKVLGWDVDRLPTIVMKGIPLGVEMMKPAEAEVATLQGEPDCFESHESDDKVVFGAW